MAVGAAEEEQLLQRVGLKMDYTRGEGGELCPRRPHSLGHGSLEDELALRMVLKRPFAPRTTALKSSVVSSSYESHSHPRWAELHLDFSCVKRNHCYSSHFCFWVPTKEEGVEGVADRNRDT